MYQGTKKHETVPDSVREWNNAVTLEERHPNNVDAAAECNLIEARSVALNRKQK